MKKLFKKFVILALISTMIGYNATKDKVSETTYTEPTESIESVQDVDQTPLSFQLVEEDDAEVVPVKVTVEDKKVSHDDFEISDTTPNWKDIIAVYAVKVTTAEDGAEVVTVDEEKAEILREVFWNMTEIVYGTETYEDTDTIETTDEHGNIIEQEVAVTKMRLVIDVKNKTATEAAAEYKFDENMIMQLSALIDTNSLLWDNLQIN